MIGVSEKIAILGIIYTPVILVNHNGKMQFSMDKKTVGSSSLKLNHRLMAVELENQQQQQREMVLTVVVTAYFVVKALVWFNKNM